MICKQHRTMSACLKHDDICLFKKKMINIGADSEWLVHQNTAMIGHDVKTVSPIATKELCIAQAI